MRRLRCPASVLVTRAGVPIVLLATVGLAGCTADAPPPGPTSAPATGDAAVAPQTPAPAGTTVDAQGGVGAHKDLGQLTCKADASGTWSFSGTVANPTKTAQKYTVELSVVDPNGWSVIGAKDVEVTVPGGKSEPVAAKAFFTETSAAAAKHQCVTRVVRHSA